jgi:hypothetical protein
MRRYNEHQRLKLLDGAFHSYSLDQRLQMNENIRAAMMLQRFMGSTSVVGVVFAVVGNHILFLL